MTELGLLYEQSIKLKDASINGDFLYIFEKISFMQVVGKNQEFASCNVINFKDLAEKKISGRYVVRYPASTKIRRV